MGDGSLFETRIADILLRHRGGDGEALLDNLVEEALRHCAGGRFGDDVCLVGLRIDEVGAAVTAGAGGGREP